MLSVNEKAKQEEFTERWTDGVAVPGVLFVFLWVVVTKNLVIVLLCGVSTWKTRKTNGLTVYECLKFSVWGLVWFLAWQTIMKGDTSLLLCCQYVANKKANTYTPLAVEWRNKGVIYLDVFVCVRSEMQNKHEDGLICNSHSILEFDVFRWELCVLTDGTGLACEMFIYYTCPRAACLAVEREK